VVGAGPAGMEAGLTAARRGHEVIVLEQSGRVGGQVWQAAGSPLRRDFAEIARYYERQVRQGVVEVRLNVEATLERVLALAPDAVVIATGATPRRVAIPALGGEGQGTAMAESELASATNGRAARPAVTVADVLLLQPANDGARRAVVLDRDGGMAGFVAADYLADQGFHVEVITPFAEPGSRVDGLNRGELCERLGARGVQFRPGADVLWWSGDSTLVVQDVFTGDRCSVEADLLVGCAGAEPVNALAAALAAHAAGVEFHLIGDAAAPRTVEEATYQGARVGRLL
jgi:NADPH-dependent 2,4-dienoyl-CoA reductase/sulfur reductase-like enzyme